MKTPRKVYCFELDKEFDSLQTAENETKIGHSAISLCCRRKRFTAGGHHWCYAAEKDIYEIRVRNTNTNYRKSKSVYCFELDREFESACQASRELGIPDCSIGRACQHRGYTAGKYHWCYVKDKDTYNISNSALFPREVYCFELDKVFENANLASKATGCDRSSIRQCCQKHISSSQGYHWCYAAEKDTYKVKIKLENIGKSVYCFELDKEFDSACQAEREMGIHNSQIGSCCKEDRFTAGSYHWCYANEKDTIDWEKKLDHKSGSKPQREIADILKKNNYNVLENVRNLLGGKEIDIYLPDYKIGIEYNGIYWHNEITKEKKYHQEKALACKKAGIKLISIFSHQWGDVLTEENLLSKIASWTGKSERIYVRKTEIEEVQTATDFFNENHVQGSAHASITFVLKMNGEIVAGMSFGKPRFTDKYQWELIRFCSKKGTQVIGGASKLLAYFVKEYQPKNIVSYSNLQWSSGGGLYEALGFSLSHLSKPNYIWMKNDQALPRQKTQKHKLAKLLGDKFNSGKSEKENMQNAGYSRVFDCGNEVYVWNVKK